MNLTEPSLGCSEACNAGQTRFADTFSLSDDKYVSLFMRGYISPRVAASSPGELVALKKSRGRISAQMVVPYPPGIPVILPGAAIKNEQLDFVDQMIHECGADAVHGLMVDRIAGEHYVRVMTTEAASGARKSVEADWLLEAQDIAREC